MEDGSWLVFAIRWLHVLSGVMWIGLLWYFNFVQIPSMPKIPDEQNLLSARLSLPKRCSGSAGLLCLLLCLGHCLR